MFLRTCGKGVLASLPLVIAMYAWAQNGSTIEGNVTWLNKPYAGATVFLYQVRTQTMVSARVSLEPNGTFAFAQVLRGAYRLIAKTRLSYGEICGKRDVDLDENTRATSSVPMLPAEVAGCPEIIGSLFLSPRFTGEVVLSHTGRTPAPAGLRRFVNSFTGWPVFEAPEPPASPRYGKAPQVEAPAGTADLHGKVIDRSSRNPVDGALVLAIDPHSGKELARARTGPSGYFRLTVARSGEVGLVVQAPAYAAGTRRVDRPEGGPDIEIPLSPAVQTAAAGAGAAVLDRTGMVAAANYSFDERLIAALPFPDGQGLDGLALLVPGVLPAAETYGAVGPGIAPGVGTAGQFSVNGLRGRENNFSIDGSDDNDEDVGARRRGFVVSFPQPLESIAEFQTIPVLPDSRFGRNIGGQANAVSKYGSSRHHGTAYGFLAGGVFKARDFFDLSSAGFPDAFRQRIPVTLNGRFDSPRVGFQPAPDGALPVQVENGYGYQPNPAAGQDPFTRTRAGGAMGGPVPWMRQTFYYASGEWQSVRASRESSFAVPAVAQRGVFGSGGTGLRAPQDSGFGGGDYYPASLAGSAIFSLYPFPNNPLGPYGANTFTEILPAGGDGRLLSLRLDRYFRIGDKHHVISARYGYSGEESVLPVTGQGLFSGVRGKLATHHLSTYFTSHIRPRFSITFRNSYGRSPADFHGQSDSYLRPSTLYPGTGFLLNAPWLFDRTLPAGAPSYGAASTAGLLAPFFPSGTAASTDAVTGALGQVAIAGFSPVGADPFSFPQRRSHHTFQWAGIGTLVRGRNTFDFGYDIRRVRLNSSIERNIRPQAVFGGLTASGDPGILYSPATLAALGAPAALFHTLSRNPNFALALRKTQGDIFGLWEFRLRSNFRLLAGYRQDINWPPDDVDPRILSAFKPDDLLASAAAAASSAGCQDIFGNPRCADLVSSLQNAFPGDFGQVFDTDRGGKGPRTGFAWDPLRDGKTAVRGGWGVYRGQFPMIAIDESRSVFPGSVPLNLARAGDGIHLFNIANPQVPNRIIANGTLNRLTQDEIALLATGLAGLARSSGAPYTVLNLVQPAGFFKNPYAFHQRLVVERQVSPDLIVTAGYLGTMARKLLRLSTPDLGPHLASVDFRAGPVSRSAFGGTPIPIPTFEGNLLPAQAGIVAQAFAIARTVFESTGSSNYHSLQAEVRRRYARKLQGGLAFTYSHAIDDVSDFFQTAGAPALPQNSLRRSERGSASFDARLRLVGHFLWDLPQFTRVRRPGGWQMSGTYAAQTGQPYTVTSVYDLNRDGNLTDRLWTADGLERNPPGDPRIRLRMRPETDILTLLGLSGSGLRSGRDGAVGRNTFRGPGIHNLDLSLARTFRLVNGCTLAVRADAFNAMNRTHFGLPVHVLEAPGFGNSTYTTTPARTIQFSLRYGF